MCVWGPSRQALGISRFRERNRMQPREDSRNRANGAAQEPEASAKIHRLPRVTQPISQSAGGEGNSIVPADEEVGEVHLDTPSKRSIPRAQAHALHCADSGCPD